MSGQGNLKPLVSELSRPVHMNWHDLDQDGQEDVIICEFGNYIGRLSWFRQTAEGAFEKRVLWENPGAVKTAVRDLDQDGWPDLLVLMAQGDNADLSPVLKPYYGLRVYHNDGDY